jgi:hypothetical protein
MKGYNFDRTIKTVISGFIRNFAWVSLALVLLIMIVPNFLGKIGMNLDFKKIAVDGIISSVCVILIYVNFINYGAAAGRQTQEYGQTKFVYLKSVSGRMRKDINEFLLFANAESRQAFERETAAEAGVTDVTEIMNINRKDTRLWSKKYSFATKRAIRMIQRGKYPKVYPRADALLTVALDDETRGHTPKIGAGSKFRKRKVATKALTSALFMSFYVGIYVERFVSLDIESAIIQGVFGVLILVVTLFFGYQNGYKSTAEIHKGEISFAIKILEEMDAWAKPLGVPIPCTVDEAKTVDEPPKTAETSK